MIIVNFILCLNSFRVEPYHSISEMHYGRLDLAKILSRRIVSCSGKIYTVREGKKEKGCLSFVHRGCII